MNKITLTHNYEMIKSIGRWLSTNRLKGPIQDITWFTPKLSELSRLIQFCTSQYVCGQHHQLSTSTRRERLQSATRLARVPFLLRQIFKLLTNKLILHILQKIKTNQILCSRCIANKKVT